MLDYFATNPNYEVTCKTSNIILHVNSDTTYLVKLGARSRAGGYFNFPTISTPHLMVPFIIYPPLVQLLQLKLNYVTYS